MELVSNEVMEVKCNHCGGIHRTENMKDFKIQHVSATCLLYVS